MPIKLQNEWTTHGATKWPVLTNKNAEYTPKAVVKQHWKAETSKERCFNKYKLTVWHGFKLNDNSPVRTITSSKGYLPAVFH